MVGVGSRIAIQLDLIKVVPGDSIDIRITQDQDWFAASEKPVLDFTVGAGDMVGGKVHPGLRSGWNGGGGRRGVGNGCRW